MGSDVTASRPTWRTAFALPDSRLELWEAESSYSAASPIAGVPEGSAGLRPVMTGTPTSTDAIELETMRGGYSDGGAAFRWRFSAGEWQYQVLLPRLSESTIIAHDGSTQVVHMDAAQQSNGRPILVTSGQATGRRITAHRLTAAGTWLSVVVIELTKSSDIIPAIVALPDGSLSIYVDLGGVRRFTSTDDGASWDEVPVYLDDRWTYPGFHSSASSTIEQLQVAYGGGSMMMLVRDDTTLTQYASEDFGATWEAIQSATDATSTEVRLAYMSGAGFVVADSLSEALVAYSDPFSATGAVVYDYTGDSIGAPSNVAFGEVDGVHWLLETANNTAIRARARFHRSLDGGATWERPASNLTDNATPLAAAAPSAIAFSPGNGTAYLFEGSSVATAGFAPGVAAHRLSGWSSQGSILTSSSDVVGWSMVYAPIPGFEPDTDPEISMNGVDTLGEMDSGASGGATASSSTGAGLEIAGASNGDEAWWDYRPDDAVVGWLQEAEVEATAGLFKLTCADGNRRVKLIIDADASTIGLYDADNAADEKDETLIGSTVVLPAGVITLRLVLDDGDAAGWYRLQGSTTWVSVGDTSVTALGSVFGVADQCKMLARADTTMDVTVHGWRVLTLGQAATLTAATPVGSDYAPWTADGVYLDAGQSVQAQGFTSYGDAWTSTPSADYSPSQLLPSRPSPRHRFESTVDTVQTLAFRVPEQEMAPSHAILIQAANARTCKVDIWTTTAGAWVTYGTVDLSRSWDDYTVLGDRRVKLGVSASSSTQDMSYIGPDELVGSTFVDSAGDLHTVVSNTEGALAPAGSGGHLGQRAILELDGTPAATGACELWFPSASAIAHHDKDIVVEGVRLTFTGLTTQTPQVASGALTVGNAVVAPMTWLSEGPDQTRTEVFEVREELDEQDDGHEYTTRSAPDRRRYELNFARLLPMYGPAAGSWDWWEATDDGEQAATPWTLPQTLSRFLGKAGRRPFVYIPAIPYHATGGQSLQPFQAVDGGARLVRCISGPFRLEGVLGQAATADQLVRGSTITLREVV